MKFFKHFTDAHRGKSIQEIKSSMGWAAIGRYWTLVEICAEKLEKKATEEYSDAHCKFEYHPTYLAATLGLGNLKQVLTFLEGVANLSLCSFERKGNVIVCYMPKLLELMDRDAKRARQVRAEPAPKKKRKRKNKEEEKEGESVATSSLPALAEIWNSNSGEKLAKVEKTNPSRNKKIEKVFSQLTPDEWTEVVKRIARSSFCCGENDRGWKATFDWLIQAETHLKVSEGKYDNKSGSQNREEFWKQFGEGA